MALPTRDPITPDDDAGAPTSEAEGYPQIPDEQPGLTGGPAVESVPHGDQPLPPDLVRTRERAIVAPQPGEEDDGGEAVLSSRPREAGGERPPKPR